MHQAASKKNCCKPPCSIHRTEADDAPEPGLTQPVLTPTSWRSTRRSPVPRSRSTPFCRAPAKQEMPSALLSACPRSSLCHRCAIPSPRPTAKPLPAFCRRPRLLCTKQRPKAMLWVKSVLQPCVTSVCFRGCPREGQDDLSQGLFLPVWWRRSCGGLGQGGRARGCTRMETCFWHRLQQGLCSAPFSLCATGFPCQSGGTRSWGHFRKREKPPIPGWCIKALGIREPLLSWHPGNTLIPQTAFSWPPN